MDWLNTEVYEEIINTEPKLSTKSLKVTRSVRAEVPFEGYSDTPNEFKRLTKAQLVPLGYDVEFTYDGDYVYIDDFEGLITLNKETK